MLPQIVQKIAYQFQNVKMLYKFRQKCYIKFTTRLFFRRYFPQLMTVHEKKETQKITVNFSMYLVTKLN